jgi:putative ABC transport system permease protein
MLANLLADVRYSLRGFALRPTFAIVVVLTLAFGIGVNVAIYSIFEQIMLRPLPVSEPERLVNLASPGAPGGSTSTNDAGGYDAVFSYQMFRDLERLEQPFASLAAHRYAQANVAFAGQTFSGWAELVSGSYFPTLGIQPALGRLLGPGDDAVEGEAAAVVLSHTYWENVLGANPGVLGETLVVNGKPLAIVGVAPADFRGTTLGSVPQVYVPITFRWSTTPGAMPNFDDRRNRWAYLFARLPAGMSIEQAAAVATPAYRAIIEEALAPVISGLTEQQTAALRARTLDLAPGARGQSDVRSKARAPLVILAIATTLVLLIACANVANLMLARGASRVGEIAVRSSMGAAPARIVGLLLVEALLLASLAAVVSLPLTLATLRGIAAFLPVEAASTFAFTLDARALAITAGLALGSALVFGLSPALKLMRTDPGAVLQAQGTRSTGSKAAGRFRAALTTTQIALSTALLVLAGWFAQSLANVGRVDVGIRTEALATFAVAPERNGYAPERSTALFEQLEQELAAVPGVTSVASAAVPLLANDNWGGNIVVEGVETAPGVDTNVAFNWVGAGFFRTVELPLLGGRELTAADSAGRAKVAIVNERFLAKFGLDRTVIGKHMSLGQGGPLDVEIIGVARDAKYSTVKDPTPAQVFLPRLQAASPFGAMNFYLRSGADAVQLRAAVELILERIDPTLPLMDFRTMREVVRENVFLDRVMSTFGAALAVLATLLAAIGLYGMLSYNVQQRSREIGLRLALGAPPARLRGMVLRQVAWLASVGGLVGLLAAVGLGRAAQALLFGLTPSDPRALLGAVGLLAIVVVAAGYLPARRAARIDPVIALRHD